jgi:Flp pilus assembly pilin Flp
VALIAVVCIAAVTTLGKNASSKFSSVGASIA